MSELMNAQNNRRGFRGQLLTTVSTVALLLAMSEAGRAFAADNFLASSDRPPFWIELGGEADQIGGGLDPYVPPFVLAPGGLTGGSSGPVIQKAPIFSFGGEGKISYEPDGTSWVFSASVRYGRAIRHKLAHQQTGTQKYPAAGDFYDAGDVTSENHFLLDFQVGRDMGLGMFGPHARSTFSLGLRYAQFSARSSGFISSAKTFYDHFIYEEKSHIDRSSMAIGPSIAWDASVPVAGVPSNNLSLDWGANAAILFGRQKANISIRSAHVHYVYRYDPPISTPSTAAGARKKSVTIPNVGGFAGISYNLRAAKVSLGYRADMYFGAIDAGSMARRSANQSFYGPFLTVGIGIGG
jgi:hypothetical protein